MSLDQYPEWPDLFRWLNAVKDRVEGVVAIGAEQVVTGELNPDLIPPIPWDRVLKADSSLGDLETRSAADLSSGTLPDARMPALTGDLSSVVGTVETLLATVNLSPGTFGSGTQIPILTVNGKGLVTDVLEQPIQTGALARVNDTNVTLTLTGTPLTALLKDVLITVGWAGTLAVSRGGTGTGTAFTAGSVVFAGASGVYAQDNANLFWDDTNNRLGVRTAAPSGTLEVLETSTATTQGLTSSQVNTAATAPLLNFKKARGSVGALTTVAAGDGLAVLLAYGYDGSNYLGMGGIQIAATGTIAATRVPTRMQFYTATDAAPSVLTERMRISELGFIGVNTTGNPSNMFVVGGTQAGNAGYEIAPGSSIVVQSFNRTGGVYTGLNFDGLSIALRPSGTQALGIIAGGLCAFGTHAATAVVHIKAGTATASTAPLKFTSGTSLTTAEAGAVEFTTDDFFATITTGAARKGIVLDDGTRLTSGRVPFATTNGRLIDDADLTFATDTLSATKIASSSLTSGKIPVASTAGLLVDGPTLGAAGLKIPAIQANGFSSAQTAAVASVATFTLSASDGVVVVAATVNVTTSVLHNFGVQVDYTDETNTAQTLTLTFTQLSAASVSAITNGTGTGPYDGVVETIRCKASTAVTVKTAGTFTSVTYNVGATLVQLA